MFKTLFFRALLILTLLVVFVPSPDAQAQTPAPFRVYLTFEDGPTDTYTPEILDILARYNTHATFFPNGYQIAGREAIMQRIMREGHAIGNHLWEEPGYYSGADPDKVRESYLKSEAAIRAALGPELPLYDAQVKLYRQPGGGALPFPETDGIQVITYNWHVDSDDCGWWLGADVPDDFDQYAIDNILNVPQADGHYYNVYDYGDGVIIAMHDINRVSGRILPLILDELSAAGATFEALPRPWDSVGTMPAALGAPPQTGNGTAGVTMPVQTNDYVRMRALPSLGATVLDGNLGLGTTLTAIGRSPGWIQVQVDGQMGWVSRDFVKVYGPIPSLPLIETP